MWSWLIPKLKGPLHVHSTLYMDETKLKLHITPAVPFVSTMKIKHFFKMKRKVVNKLDTDIDTS